MNVEKDRGVESFESALRRWGARPPHTAPGHAATRIAASVGLQAPASHRWRPVLAAVALLVLAFTLLLVPTAPPTRVAEQALAGLPLDEDVVLWWLDEDTPVYFVLPPSHGPQGGTS